MRIGDPDAFVTGRHEYVIEYRITGALQSMAADDAVAIGGQGGDAELYWDFVGSGWEVPIASARATVTGPADILAVGCFTGPYGSQDTCPTSMSGATATFGPSQLDPGSSLTGAAAWPASAFTAPITQDIRMGATASAGRGAVIGGVAGVLAVAVMCGLAIAFRRRDRGVSMPLAPAMYGPPSGLAPAEMAAALEGVGSTPTSLMATFLDLAARGWLGVAVNDGQVTLTRQAGGAGVLRDWEGRLLEAVFAGRSTKTLGEYDALLEAAWTHIGITLVDTAEADGYRNREGGRPDRRWLWPGVAGAVIAVLSVGWLVFGGASLAAAAGAVLGGCLVVGSIVATIITPRAQTPTSARFLSEVAGLAKVLSTDAAASRQRFAQTTGLGPAAILATMLPYAVALGLEDAWVAAFPEIGRDELASNGLEVSSALLLPGLVQSGVVSSYSALSPPPEPSTSSGGSGFSGGGVAGGGGGGGGGGSW